ncbi:glycosyltransferase family 4 protein [Chloroflexota bacterium]
MEIDYIKGIRTTTMSGISKYQREIHKRLESTKLNIIDYTPLKIRVRGSGVIDRMIRYPYLVRKRVEKGNVKHIISQDLAYLLVLLKLENTIVTCYDLIHWVYDNDHSLGWKMNLRGMKRANAIITCAEYSRNDIMRYTYYPEDKIHVVYPGVDHNLYYPRKSKEILRTYGISDTHKVVLYVGSEQPRQNVPLLIEAFSKLVKILPDVKLLKIGRPQWTGARENLMKLIESSDLQRDVLFIDNISEDDLPKWYNAADLYVYPGLYAGLSMPCLEALACGIPVISCPISIAMEEISSLPEDVGDAAMLVNPYDTNQLAEAMYEVLTNDSMGEDMRRRGLERVKKLSWEKAAIETLEVYEKVYGGY